MKWFVLVLLASCSGTQPAPLPWTTNAQTALIVAAHAVDVLDVVEANAYTAAARDAGSLVALDAHLMELIEVRRQASVALVTARDAVEQMRLNPATRCIAGAAVHLAGIRLAQIGALTDSQPIVEATHALATVEAVGPSC